MVSFFLNSISSFGYAGIFLVTVLQSAGIPIPIEVVMPFCGFLISQEKLNFYLTILFATSGSLLGSMFAYALGFWGQERVVRKIIKKWGKYILISEKRLEKGEKWFRKYGEIIVFSGRFLPVVRTFISFPAGVAKMNFAKFSLYTAFGSFFCSLYLTYLGLALGQKRLIIPTTFP